MNYKKTESYAPVLIIAFNRFDHFRQLIDSLILNDEKSNTKYIFILMDQKMKMIVLLLKK